MTLRHWMKVSPAELKNSEAANVLWLVCGSWHNSEVTKRQSTMLILNVRRLEETVTMRELNPVLS